MPTDCTSGSFQFYFINLIVFKYSLGYNSFPLITHPIVRTEHRSHGLLYKMIGYNELAYNENPLLTNEFSKTDSINSIRL